MRGSEAMLYWALRLGGLWALVTVCQGADGPIADTTSGQVQGYVQVSRGADNFLTFAGIPYAKPPVGDLRFEPPQPADSWNGIRQAKEHGPRCPQVIIYFGGSKEGEEDCLYLSVFTRKLDGKAPVMVHIHGGDWLIGNGPRWKTPEYLMDYDIVVVDVNYRLGILGFLSFEDSNLPGNMGMKDQVLALKWVKENIKNFGGDPDQITIMGECAGGDAVVLHMISPMSTGLFHRGIAESGSAYSATGVTVPGVAKERAMKLADMMGCKGSTKDILKCLRKKDAMDIASKFLDFLEWHIDPYLSFGPVLEPNSPDAFLSEPVSKWPPIKVPLLTGITSGEGLLRTVFFIKNNYDFGDLNGDGFNTRMPASLMLTDTSTDPDGTLKKIRDYYLPGKTISINDLQNITDMYGDMLFTYGVIEGAKLSSSDVYMYYFDYVGEVTKLQFFGDKTKRKGAFHTDEDLYIWQYPGVPPLKGRDYEMSRDILKLFTNFIMNGDPTPNDEMGFKWLPYMPEENYLCINEDGFKMEKGLIADRYKFWKSINFRDKYP